MDREAGPHVAVQDSFGYGSHPFYQHHLAAGNGYGSVFGSKQAGLSARLNSSAEETSADDHPGNAEWEGFTSFRLPVGPRPGKPVHLFDAERQHLTGASDLRLAMADSSFAADICTDERRRKQSSCNGFHSVDQVSAQRRENISEQDSGSLALKLSFTGADDLSNGIRTPKRFRPSSPGNQAPICQVDDCHMDLKHAKDYHRRHKVCESHSKAPQSLVQKVLQRFCQQCSRFHPLPEFDEGKRSCRRRLAGHNKRRRKTDLATNSTPLSEAVKGADPLIGLVALLSHLQATKGKGKPDSNAIEHELSLQCLRKPASLASLFPVSCAVAPQNHQSSRGPPQSNLELQEATSSPLEGLSRDALALFLRNVLQNQAVVSQGRTQLQKRPSQLTSNDQNVRALHSHAGNSSEDHSRNVLGDSLLLDLAGKLKSRNTVDPSEMCSRPAVIQQYLGRTNSVSLEEDDPESPPNSTATRLLEEQIFFPIECGNGLKSAGGDRDGRTFHELGLDFQEEDLNLSPCYPQPEFEVGVDKSTFPPSDSSEYASDQSPSSCSSNEQGMRKNGRIIFKLCDPQHVETMTQTHESEIQQWLSLKPCCLEGYLRPGCVLLTFFLSMPQKTWDQLVTNLPGSLEKLVCLSQSTLWTKGRIIVQVGHQRALIVNGSAKNIKFSKTSKGPHLRSVRPLAIVAGQKATLSVYGYNLVPETRIVCVYGGRYILQEVPFSSSKCRDVNCFSSASRNCCTDCQEVYFPGGPPNVIGRCFIEVEYGFMGNALPVIIANKEICAELQSLELDLDSDFCKESDKSRDSSLDEFHVTKEAEAMNFLHELGWIFQSTSEWVNESVSSNGRAAPQIGLSRFKGVLKYAILRDWCAVVKQLLDLLFLFGVKDDADIACVLFEINLLHQAVKRKCKPMVDLLLQYIPVGHGPGKENIFTPVAEGPGGFTPLHVAASMSDAEEILDALTEDSHKAGLHGWKSALDLSGRTPEWLARHTGNFSYIDLVEKKLSMELSPSVRITIPDKSESCTEAHVDTGNSNTLRTQAVGSTALEISDLPRRPTSNSPQECRDCRKAARRGACRSARPHSRMYRPLMMMMVAVAAVCATVALLYKTGPMLDCATYSLRWEGIMYGPL